MDDKKQESNDQSLPDISHVFEVDESLISSELTVPPVTGDKKGKGQPIMLSNTPEEEKREKARLQKHRAIQKSVRIKKQKKKRRKTALLILTAVLLLCCSVFGIITAFGYQKRPEVILCEAERTDIKQHYDTKCMIENRIIAAGKLGSVALFIENDYDIYGLTQGLSAEISNENGEFLTIGTVQSITRIDSDDSLLGKLIAALPEDDYSAAANFLVTVQLLDYLSADEIKTADVSIITDEAENVLTVASDGVFRENTQYYVWCYQPLTHKITKTQVSVGFTADNKTVITEGIDEKQQIVFPKDENVLLQDGEKVRKFKPGGTTDEKN